VRHVGDEIAPRAFRVVERNGEAIEVETQITVNFNFGGG